LEKQGRKINKEWKGRSSIHGERLYIEIISMKITSFGGSKFWALIIDDFLSNCWRYY
jgi:hypothetical protein